MAPWVEVSPSPGFRFDPHWGTQRRPLIPVSLSQRCLSLKCLEKGTEADALFLCPPRTAPEPGGCRPGGEGRGRHPLGEAAAPACEGHGRGSPVQPCFSVGTWRAGSLHASPSVSGQGRAEARSPQHGAKSRSVPGEKSRDVGATPADVRWSPHVSL